MDFGSKLAVEKTGIAGLKLLRLTVHCDGRGWFKENWQREKMVSLGLPDLCWVQNNISFNARRGVTRGIHAEPWNKLVSVATGSVFGAWVDLRQGSSTFGRVFTATLDPARAVFVPRGVGNAFQALEDATSYTYMVDAHWSAELKKTYTFVSLFDAALAIDWPIPLKGCEISEADRHHPPLADVVPMAPKRTLVTGCAGQLGRAIRAFADARGLGPTFDYHDIDGFDFSDPAAYDGIDWDLYGTVINCGAYTAVDRAETTEGRISCWKANAVGPALLARACAEYGITLVHISSDYVFDGVRASHDELEPLSPLSVYGQAKAAGDLAVAGCPSHYIVRSSWVIGDGRNFVRSMAALSDRVADAGDELDHVTVVDDQNGRLTFTDQMAEGIFYLLQEHAPYGTYDLTGSGHTKSWYEIASEVFELRNANSPAVIPVSTAEYYGSFEGPIALRPRHSTLSLDKVRSVGFIPRDWEDELKEYVARLPR